MPSKNNQKGITSYGGLETNGIFRCFLYRMPRVMSISCKGHVEILIANNAICKQWKTFTGVGDQFFLVIVTHLIKRCLTSLPPLSVKQSSETSNFFFFFWPSQIRLVTSHWASELKSSSRAL